MDPLQKIIIWVAFKIDISVIVWCFYTILQKLEEHQVLVNAIILSYKYELLEPFEMALNF